MNRRVVITGLGVISPVGNSVEKAWKNIKAGKSGVGKITLFDSSDLDVHIAAEVKDFNFEDFELPRKLARKTARFSQFCLAASSQAVKDSGYTKELLSKEKCGVVAGCCIGGIEAASEGFSKLYNPDFGPSRISPLTTPLMIVNEAAANVSIYFGLHSLSWTLSNACSSGTDSLGLALDLIRSGRCDVCLAGGTDASITEFSVACYSNLMALTPSFSDEPEKASRPFDKKRNGFVLGEGSAMFVLEDEEHAKKRGAHIYAELAGYGASCDAYHITAPLPDGSAAYFAVTEALRDAGMEPEDIQYYNAHGTSTVVNDASETCMIKKVFGEYARSLSISSTKSMTGHLVGAAGAIEALFCVKAINDGFVPPTINLEEQDVEGGCDLNYTANKGVVKNIDAAASVSLGFGGHNGCVIIKKYKE